MTKYMISGNICRILKKIQSSGERAYLVGGCVRDMVLGRRVHDWDIASSSMWEKTARLFSKSAATGAKYGTVTVFYRGTKAEVTTFRCDAGYSDMRHPDKVEFTSDLNKDLARRDFTMNAMAMDLDGEIADIFGGMADIENGIIRCVGDPDRRFAEDALRMFRALRFSAQLGFEIEERTKKAVLKNARRASAVSAERIREELLKTINSPRPERAADMFASGLFGDIRGNMDLLCKMAGRLKYLPKSGRTRLIALAGALGEAADINAGSFLERLHCGRKTLELAGAFSYVPCDSVQEIKVSCSEYGAEKTMAACAVCDAVYGGKRYRILRGFLKSGLPHSAGELPIGGRELMELGVVPGEEMGEMLKRLYRHVCFNPEDTAPERLFELAREYMLK